MIELKAGYGYWSLDRHPIGGEFHRTGSQGLSIKQIIKHFDKHYYGSNVECETSDGKRIACDANHLNEFELIRQV